MIRGPRRFARTDTFVPYTALVRSADAAVSVAAARERTGGGARAGEVGSGAERSPLGGEHDGPAVGVGVEGLERCRDLPDESGVEEVVRWTPQPHHPDETLVLHFATGPPHPPLRARHHNLTCGDTTLRPSPYPHGRARQTQERTIT